MMKNCQLRCCRLIAILSILCFVTCLNLCAQHNVPLDQWIRDYARDYCAEDWVPLMKKYGWEEGYEPFLEIRASYTNLNMEVVKSVTDGKNIMAWLKCTANYTKKLENNAIEEDILSHIEPKGQKVEWEEVWSFSVENGLSNDDWKIMFNDRKRLASVGADSYPQGFIEKTQRKKYGN